MRVVLLAGMSIITAPASAADWRFEKPFIVIESSKSLDQLSGCISEAWQSRSGQVGYAPKERGFTMRLTYSMFGQPLVAVLIAAADVGETRRVEVRARKGDRGDKLRKEVSSCV